MCIRDRVSGAKGMFGGMFDGMQGAVNDPKSFVESMGGTVKDGNIGTPTAQEQKDFDTLAASKAKIKQSQAKLSPNQPSPAAPPTPPAGGGSNVKVVRVPSPSKDKGDKQSFGGSEVDAVQTGNGNKAKWNILGIPMPF